MKTVRIRFSKTGRARYISHLDLSRVMQRALRRADVPLWYTEGFNRHPYVTFAAPLSLGFEGLRETMDFRLVEDMAFDELVRRLDEAVPEGIRVLSAAEPVMKPGQIARARYRLTVDGGLGRLEEFLNLPEIGAEKRTKKGEIRRLDLKPSLLETQLSGEEGKTLWELLLPCGGETVNPSLVWSAYTAFSGDSRRAAVLRLELYDQEGRPFE
ncbi:MAG: DUF2344 domain-containing protein [Clostridiales bacterium]|nr:DUF2344 domain-containing protein [Clostridiales bacterium]